MKVSRSPRPAFTLVELMVSIGVLSLLILLITQLFNSASLTVTGSQKRLDADGIARTVFDRMSSDFETIVKRPDVDYDFNKQTGNDSMYFYAESSGYPSSSATGASTVSLVGYRINDRFQMERLGQRLAWNGTNGVVFLTYPNGGPTPNPSGTIAQNFSSVINETDPTSSNYYYDVIGDGVFRMEFCFQLRDGSFSNVPYLSPNTTANGLSDVAAAVVAIAVMDPSSKHSVPVNGGNIPQFETAADLLADFIPSGSQPVLMAKQWNNDWIASIGSNTTGLPAMAASQVRIYQRFFYLNTR